MCLHCANLNLKVSGLCPLGSAGFEGSVKSITGGAGVAAVWFPGEGGPTEEAMFRGCMAGGAGGVSMSCPQSARFRNRFFGKRTKIMRSHRVGTVLIIFFRHEFKFDPWRKALYSKASWQDDNLTRGSM